MNNDVLPVLTKFDGFSNKKNVLFMLSEGFEERSIEFAKNSKSLNVKKILICKYSPEKEQSKYNALKDVLLDLHLDTPQIELVYHRVDPFDFEINLESELRNVNEYDEIIVDISVMSKYMIMQIICSLIRFSGRLRIIYTEPTFHAPTEDEYKKRNLSDILSRSLVLPSTGVQSIVRTPLLTSIIMQKSPVLLVAFLSFNEQLVRALLAECNPTHLYLINEYYPGFPWRGIEIQNIHKYILKEYLRDNPLDDSGALPRRASVIDYRNTFELLSDIYSSHCIENRIVVAPTGTKMQALGCSLIKLCCPDIHIEYPIPESYYIDGYSSSEIRQIHQVVFDDLPQFIKQLSVHYELN